MGTCLAVIKVIGTTTLGIYAGSVLTATSGYDILVQVLTSSSPVEMRRANGVVSHQVSVYGGIVTALGVISTTAFQLAYTSASKSMKHPYLIYASLVFPLSSAVWYFTSGSALVNWYKFPELIEERKQKQQQQQTEKKNKVVSDLDNSIYKDLGDDTSADEAGQAEDELIVDEVEAHLTQKAALNALEKLQFGNKIVSGLSVVGFVIATIGVYGDY